MARSSTTRPRTQARPGGGNGPVPVALPRRRTFGDFLRSIGAFLALAVLLVGVPFGLIVSIGYPLPHHVPNLGTLEQQVSTTVFLKVLSVAVWLAWAQFTACVLVEFKGALSGVGLPTRVPGAGPSQALARQLVAALLLISAGAMSFAPGLSSLGQHSSEPVRAAMSVSAQRAAGGSGSSAATTAGQQGHGQSGSGGSQSTTATRTSASSGTKFYRIEPPDGRHHDSLWEIAQRHLGNGRRYEEIYQLNKDRVQPDGSKLTKASLIRPGWILEMPADATGGDLVELQEVAPPVTPAPAQAPAQTSAQVHSQALGQDQTGDQTQEQAQAQAQAQTHETAEPEYTDHAGGVSAQEAAEIIAYAEHGPHAVILTDPVVTPLGQAPVVEAPVAPTPAPVEPAPVVQAPVLQTPEPPSAGTTHATATASSAESSTPAALLEALAAAPLLAAGLLAALGRKRRAQLWRGAVGLFPRMPRGRAVDAEDSLRIGASPDEAEFLGTALRGLAALMAAEGRPLPVVYAAWLTPEGLYLQLPWSHGYPPAPWQVDESADGSAGNSWVLDRIDLTAAYRRAAGTASAAPFPGLVGLGSHEGSQLLMNLEAAPGLISISGAPQDRNAVLNAIAAELATNSWSDRMALTLVGFDCDLTVLAPDRIRHLPGLDSLLGGMESEADGRRAALDAAGLDSVLTGRGSAANPTAWSPHLVVVAAEPDPAQSERLARLAADAGRLGIGYIVAQGATELPGAAWELRTDASGRTRAPLLGLDVLAQRLPDEEVDALLQLFTGTGSLNGTANGSSAGAGIGGVADNAPPSPDEVFDLRSLGTPAVQAGLLGGFTLGGTLAGVGGVAVERLPQLQEALVLLLLHREGVHPAVLSASLWPGGVTEDVAETFGVRLRDWLGRNAHGQWRLTGDGDGTDGRLRLDAGVQSDWDLFRSLRDLALHGREAALDPGAKEQLLAQALRLVRGPFLADRPTDRYGWLRHELVEAQVPSLVADTALALAALRSARGDAGGAAQALETGLLCAPSDERLARERLRAVHATGDELRFAALLGEVVARADTSAGGRGLPPRTQALLDEIHPAWRGRIAG